MPETATVDCQVLRCGRNKDPHFFPYPKDRRPFPSCPFDGTVLVVDEADSWCVRNVWDDVMRLFGIDGREGSDET